MYGESYTHTIWTRIIWDIILNLSYMYLYKNTYLKIWRHISSKTVIMLPYFVYMFVFRLKGSMLQKGKCRCSSWQSRDNISGAWSQILQGKHCSTYEQQGNNDLSLCPLTGNKSFKLIRKGRTSVNMENSLCFVISIQILHYHFWSLFFFLWTSAACGP